MLPIIVGHVVTVPMSGLRGRSTCWRGRGGDYLLLLPLHGGLVIDSEEEVGLVGQLALGVQVGQERGPAPSALLHDAPGTVQGLSHVPHLPMGLTQLVSLLLQLGT